MAIPDSDIKGELATIRLKILKLKQQNDELASRLEGAEKQLNEWKKAAEEQKNTIALLKEQNKITKLADALVNDEADLQDLKKKVNAYIRDLDACIRLLSER